MFLELRRELLRRNRILATKENSGTVQPEMRSSRLLTEKHDGASGIRSQTQSFALNHLDLSEART